MEENIYVIIGLHKYYLLYYAEKGKYQLLFCIFIKKEYFVLSL